MDSPKKRKKNIAIFASGAGTNTSRIIEYCKTSEMINIALIVSNNPNAGVLNVAVRNNIEVLILKKDLFFSESIYIEKLKSLEIDIIVLAGFLWKIPKDFIAEFKNMIINIHPALLPKYGGKGMYGANVHASVIAAAEKESGITIHHVNEHYDDGNIIFQAKCSISENDTPETLAEKVHELEYKHFAGIIEDFANR